jgi:AcrR family transcriptional regulator
LTAKVNKVYHHPMAGRPKVREDRLDEDAIAEAALELASERLSDLTMRALSAKLRVSAGALYKHVAGRDALIALVVEKVLALAPPMSVDCADGWLALRAQVLGMQALVDHYPGLDQVIISYSPASPQANRLRQRGIEALASQGLTHEQALYVYRAVTYLWLGSRVAVQGRRRNNVDIDTFTDALDILLRGLRSELTGARPIAETAGKQGANT